MANGDLHVVEPAPVTPVLPLEIPEPPAAPTILADDPAASRPLPLPAPHDEPVALDVPAPQEARLLLRRYRQLSDRDLAAQLAGAAAYDARVIQQVLRERQSTTTARGPSTPWPTLLDAERELFDRVSGLPPAEGRRLLRDLAASNSEPADIRLQALTLLATSGDPQLASIARQRALEDADPRVADLAAKILRDQQTK